MERSYRINDELWHCIKCDRDRTSHDYTPKMNKDGVSIRCKECLHKQQAEYRARNRERIREYANAYYKLSMERNEEENRYNRRQSQLLHFYSITIEQYDLMLQQQNGLCGVCGKTDNQRRLSVDHDHSCCSGKRSCGKCVRGLLCGTCNTNIASFEMYKQEYIDWMNRRAYFDR